MTRRPRAFSNRPRLEAVSPLPRLEATPPVTKMCLVTCDWPTRNSRGHAAGPDPASPRDFTVTALRRPAIAGHPCPPSRPATGHRGRIRSHRPPQRTKRTRPPSGDPGGSHPTARSGARSPSVAFGTGVPARRFVGRSGPVGGARKLWAAAVDRRHINRRLGRSAHKVFRSCRNRHRICDAPISVSTTKAPAFAWGPPPADIFRIRAASSWRCPRWFFDVPPAIMMRQPRPHLRTFAPSHRRTTNLRNGDPTYRWASTSAHRYVGAPWKELPEEHRDESPEIPGPSDL